eukprot:scaffold266857_cov34-Prasinocladus_malaysianus.AAC.2
MHGQDNFRDRIIDPRLKLTCVNKDTESSLVAEHKSENVLQETKGRLHIGKLHMVRAVEDCQ